MPSQQTDLVFTNWTINGDSLRPCMCLPGYEFIDRTTSVQYRGMHVCAYTCTYLPGAVLVRFLETPCH